MDGNPVVFFDALRVKISLVGIYCADRRVNVQTVLAGGLRSIASWRPIARFFPTSTMN